MPLDVRCRWLFEYCFKCFTLFLVHARIVLNMVLHVNVNMLVTFPMKVFFRLFFGSIGHDLSAMVFCGDNARHGFDFSCTRNGGLSGGEFYTLLRSKVVVFLEEEILLKNLQSIAVAGFKQDGERGCYRYVV